MLLLPAILLVPVVPTWLALVGLTLARLLQPHAGGKTGGDADAGIAASGLESLLYKIRVSGFESLSPREKTLIESLSRNINQ